MYVCIMYMYVCYICYVCMYVFMYITRIARKYRYKNIHKIKCMYVCMYVATCGVYISEELIGHISHFAEDGQVAGPLDLQAIGPGLAQQIVLTLFTICMYVCM